MKTFFVFFLVVCFHHEYIRYFSMNQFFFRTTVNPTVNGKKP